MSALSHRGDYLPLTNHWIVACVVLSLSYSRPYVMKLCTFNSGDDSQMLCVTLESV